MPTGKTVKKGYERMAFKAHVWLRWPNTVLARALADAIQRGHKDCKEKKIGVDTAIILFLQVICVIFLHN